jgi:hypothetical protein
LRLNSCFAGNNVRHLVQFPIQNQPLGNPLRIFSGFRALISYLSPGNNPAKQSEPTSFSSHEIGTATKKASRNQIRGISIFVGENFFRPFIPVVPASRHQLALPGE